MEGGFHSATTDPEVIRQWWAIADYNLGMCPEDAGLCVIDPDGEAGKLWLHSVELPSTRTVATAHDGRHLYFEGSLASTVGKLAPKVDTRGRGGYVLVPPSIVDGKPYRVVDDTPPAPLPEWVASLAASRELVPIEAPEWVVLDSEWMVNFARDYLQRVHEKEGPWGQEDDPHTYKIAADIKDMGISEDLAGDLLMEYLPETEREWLEKTVNNAYRFGKHEIGAKAYPAPATWEVEKYAPPPAEPELQQPTFPPVLTAFQLSKMHFEPPAWVWENRLLEREPNLYTGDSGVGKTTLAENLAVAVAAGVPLLGGTTTQMPVLLLAAEDTYGPVRDNLLAIREALQAPEGCLDQIHVLSVKSDRIQGGHKLVTIGEDGTVGDTPFMRYLAQQLAAVGPCLFVVDPLDEFATFDRYKDAPCRALATTWGRRVCEDLGATLLVNDHPSKASMASGEHYAGSVQLKAAFTLFATLKGGNWSGSSTRQRDMTFSVIKGRYAGEEDTRFIRSSKSPAFILMGGPNHQPDDHQIMVYRHILDCVANGKVVNLRNGSGHGPEEVAFKLQLDEKTVKAALVALCGREWLRKDEKGAGYVAGPKSRSVEELDGY